MRRALAPLALALALGCGAGGGEGGAPRETGAAPRAAAPAAPRTAKTRIRVGGVVVRVELAATPAARARGLMHRRSLPEDEGMLFVYERERPLSFWMRNTHVPLDIAFLDREGRILDIQAMEPRTETPHLSPAPAMYALEMRQGWFADHGIRAGDAVAFQVDEPARAVRPGAGASPRAGAAPAP